MKNTKINLNTFLIILLIVTAAMLRFIPHTPNFTPIGAIALFGGAHLKKHWSYIIPIVAMFFSDLYIGFYTLPIMAAVYISFLTMVYLGSLARTNQRFSQIFGLTLTGSVIFFLLTNLAVWAFTPMYLHNISGLVDCYIAALPFFRNSLLGDLFYTGVLFGSFKLIIRHIPIRMILIKNPN